uniref:Nif11 domain-containing protein n=1 Tax=Cyanothece sp. (strain PCC 7425 / ATCC 29141) TaxID=395961 RepID=B8HQG7_CYAP4
MTQSLEQFKQQVLQDPTLAEQFKAASSPDEFVNLAVQLGQQLGYSFTAEDIQTALSEQSATGQPQELDDSQLEAIAGGGDDYAGDMANITLACGQTAKRCR